MASPIAPGGGRIHYTLDERIFKTQIAMQVTGGTGAQYGIRTRSLDLPEYTVVFASGPLLVPSRVLVGFRCCAPPCGTLFPRLRVAGPVSHAFRCSTRVSCQKQQRRGQTHYRPKQRMHITNFTPQTNTNVAPKE